MNITNELINTIKTIGNERRIPHDAVTAALKDAIIRAYVKEYPETELEVDINLKNNTLEINKLFKVIAADNEDFNDYNEMILVDAKKLNKDAAIGDIVKESIDIQSLDRALVGHILQIFKHNISSESNKTVFDEWKNKVGDVMFLEVESAQAGSIVVNVGGGVMGIVPYNEQIPGEKIWPGKKYNFYVKEVVEHSKGWPVILSRADAGLVKYFLTLTNPEIQENIIEIKKIARIAGFKTKVAVVSHHAGIDAVSAVVGQRGERIKKVREQINNENIELVHWTDDLIKYVTNVCSPAEIAGILVEQPKEMGDKKAVTLICRDEKLPLLIGKKGSNVRIISQLLDANVEVLTIEEANDIDLKYDKVDYKAMGQSTYARALNKFRPSMEQFNSYNDNAKTYQKSVSEETKVVHTPKKETKNYGQSFKEMNTNDLFKDMDWSNSTSAPVTHNNTNEEEDNSYEDDEE